MSGTRPVFHRQRRGRGAATSRASGAMSAIASGANGRPMSAKNR
jgi:hypothetical protein